MLSCLAMTFKSVFNFSLFFPVVSVLLEPQDRNLSHGWLIFGALLAEVSQFPLFRGINLDLATCLRPFRTRGSRSGVKVVKRRYGHVTRVARCRDFHFFFVCFFSSHFLFACFYIVCFQMLSLSLMLTHVHTLSCVCCIIFGFWSTDPHVNKKLSCFETKEWF